jgi:ferredoxin, 2Fe-2S
MVRITFERQGDDPVEIDVLSDVPLSQHGMPGLPGNLPTVCHLDCRCLSCHCHPDPAFALVLPPMTASEDHLLDRVPQRQDTSRLACQIRVTAALDGLHVSLSRRDVEPT